VTRVPAGSTANGCHAGPPEGRHSQPVTPPLPPASLVSICEWYGQIVITAPMVKVVVSRTTPFTRWRQAD
jgi:hypothetical protein